MSSSSESTSGRRVARIAGVLLLLVVQGGCAATLATLVRLAGRETPSRAVLRARAEAAGPTPPVFPSVLGYVEHFDRDDVFTVMTADSRRRVRVDRDTVVMTASGRAPFSALYPGVGVTISGAVDGSGEVLAEVVLVRPPP